MARLCRLNSQRLLRAHAPGLRLDSRVGIQFLGLGLNSCRSLNACSSLNARKVFEIEERLV